MGDPTARLLELDAWHGELLERLTVLDEQIETVLTGWVQTKNVFPEKNTENSEQESVTALAAMRKSA